jgi:hypothetical protein
METVCVVRVTTWWKDKAGFVPCVMSVCSARVFSPFFSPSIMPSLPSSPSAVSMVLVPSFFPRTNFGILLIFGFCVCGSGCCGVCCPFFRCVLL